jgi:PKD repeat protein
MRTIFSALFLSLAGFCATAQTVKTYAGVQYTGSGSYTGYRNNHKDTVLFSAPMGIDIDTLGRLYVSNEHNIFWVKADRGFLAAGYTLDPTYPSAADSKDGGGSIARFSRPAGLAIHPRTNELFVADLDNNQIRKMEPYINNATQQIVSTFAGVKLFNGAHLDAANASAKFNGPSGIAVAANGDVYVADRNNHVIRKISGGSVTTIAGSPGNAGYVNATGSAARFAAPYNVYLDGNDLLVADYGNSAIRKINLSTNAVSDVVNTGLFGPKDLCKVGSALYIVESLCIKKYDNSNLVVYAGNANQNGYTDAVGTAARFEDLSDIVYDNKGGLFYVVDMGNNVVRSIVPSLAPVCSFVASTTSATKGQTVILTNTSTNKPTTFKWTISPSSYSLLNNTKLTDSVVYVSFSQAGTYSIKLYVANLSGSDSLLKSNHIAVSSVTVAPVADFMASDTTPLLTDIISLIDLSSNTPTTWTWRISPSSYKWMNATDSNSKIPNVQFTATGKYTVTLIASNASGSNTMSKKDYINIQSSSIDNTEKAGFVIYPNPTDDVLHIVITDPSIFELYNAYGLLVQSNELMVGINAIPVSELPTGAYILKIKSKQGQYSHKVIVNH